MIEESKGLDLNSDEYGTRYEKLVEFAQLNNLELRTAGPNELFVDLDDVPSTERAIAELDKKLEAVDALLFRVQEVYWRVSPGGKGLHVRVVFPSYITLDYRERSSLQMYLGSDPKRELLTLKEARLDEKDNGYYFLDKPANPEVKSKRWPVVDMGAC